MPSRIRARARTLRSRLVNAELQQLEAVRQRLEAGAVDVLVLGDSSCLTAAADDTDRRMIPELLGRQLGGARVATVAGPGFEAQMYGEMLRILGTLAQRPTAVVVAMSIRTNTAQHVLHHPIYSYPATRAALSDIESAHSRIRFLGKGHEPGPADYAAFEATTVRTRWGGQTTIGEARARVRSFGPQPWPAERERVLFDYFHGEVVAPDNPALRDVTLLGSRLADFGVPARVYWTLPPLPRGEMLFPGEFTDHARANWGQLSAALRAAAPDLTIIEPELDDVDFEDGQNGTEHYAFSGRHKVATAVAETLETV